MQIYCKAKVMSRAFFYPLKSRNGDLWGFKTGCQRQQVNIYDTPSQPLYFTNEQFTTVNGEKTNISPVLINRC